MNQTTELEIVDGARANYLAANPEARRVHESHMATFHGKFDPFLDGAANLDTDIDEIVNLFRRGKEERGRELFRALLARALPLKVVLFAFINKAENAREIGIGLCEWEETLPGKKLTRDLFQQHKHELTNAQGQSLSFELVEWLMRVARENADAPIDSFRVAARYKDGFFAAVEIGNPDFKLESDRPPQSALPAPDPRVLLNRLCDVSAFKSIRASFTQKYFVDGDWVPGAIDVMAGQLKPFFDEVQSFREELGI